MVGKDKTINIRISSEEHKNVKKYHAKFSEIWEIGYSHWIRKIPDLLYEKVHEYKKLYEQCKDNFEKSSNKARTIDAELESICKLYLDNTERSIDNPTRQDRYWIKSRLEKFDGITEEIFLERCKFLKECEKNE